MSARCKQSERYALLICTSPEFGALAQEVGLTSHRQGVTEAAERARCGPSWTA